MCLYITLFFISQDSLVLVQKNVSLLSQSLLWFMNKKKKNYMPYSVYVRGFTKASSDFSSGYQACSDGVRTSAYAG